MGDAPIPAQGADRMLDLVFTLAAIASFGAIQLFARWLDRLEGREAP